MLNSISLYTAKYPFSFFSKAIDPAEMIAWIKTYLAAGAQICYNRINNLWCFY